METFKKIADDTQMKELAVSRRFESRLRPWAQQAGVTLLGETMLDKPPVAGTVSCACPFPVVAPDRDLAALMFTSGSTGSPKGVMVSHRNIECNSLDIVSYLELGAKDRAMVVLPLHYCFGLSLLHTLLAVGGSVVLNNEFMYPEAVVQDMLQKECTGFAGVPSTYQILLRKSRFRDMTFPKLRWLQQAGGKLPNPHIAEILKACPGVRYFLMYGQTEATARLSYLPPECLADKLGSIGKGLPSTHLEVLRPDGVPVIPGSNECGEIVATGENVTLGYWNDPVETAKYFRNGKLYTGDVARVDSDGFIFIVEREREIIKSGGNRVSGKEVEDVIAELPEVVEVAVVGVSHELLGEAILAYVVVTRNAGLSPEDVQAHCRKRLPSFKVPESVMFIQTMPHNEAGKVLKSQLREMALSPTVCSSSVS
jgi:acyl-CoA synthetase (AMP-forming)/AMP-acid ligase II